MIDNSSYVETHLKDHLGNIRIAYTYKNGSVIVKQSNNYYPFGMNIKELSLSDGSDATSFSPNENKYNNKMFQDEIGLNWYDYGARFYDPVVGRWWAEDPMSEVSRRWSPYSYCYNNPIRFIDPDGMKVDNFYFNKKGELVKREINSKSDKFYVQTGESNIKKNELSTIYGETVTNYIKVETPYKEIEMDSDVGSMARAVYAEMGGEDQNSKQIVAESIKNRTELPEEKYEHADNYKEAIDKAYDVAKPNNDANSRFTNPELTTEKNPGDREAFANSVGIAIKVDNSTKSQRIGQGVIFYNSSSSTIYDNNVNMVKINLNFNASGIKGAWKLKDQ